MDCALRRTRNLTKAVDEDTAMTDASAKAVKGGRDSRVAKGEDVEMADGTEHQQELAPECPNLNDLDGDSRCVVV